MAPSLRDRWLGLRDRLLISADFQRFAARFPLTRPVATAEASGLFDLCAGFVYSQILYSCVRLDLFATLRDGPLAMDRLAEETGLPLPAAERLVRAAVALRLLETRSGGRVGLGARGAAALGNPVVTAMVEHHALLYRDLTDPVALLRGEAGETELQRYWPYASDDDPASGGDEAVSAYTALMSASQAGIADEVLDAYPMRGPESLLDLGGGDASFAIAVARRHPDMQISVFDLPAVARQAAARIEAEGLSARIRATGGDFLSDDLPSGAEIVSLVRILLDHPDETALAILKAARRALPEHGIVLVAEPLSGRSPGMRVADAYFGFYLMAMGDGRARTLAEHRALLEAAGFGPPRVLTPRRPVLTRVLIARTA